MIVFGLSLFMGLTLPAWTRQNEKLFRGGTIYFNITLKSNNLMSLNMWCYTLISTWTINSCFRTEDCFFSISICKLDFQSRSFYYTFWPITRCLLLKKKIHALVISLYCQLKIESCTNQNNICLKCSCFI